MTTKFDQAFMNKIDSGSPVLWVYLSGDEGRAERTLDRLAKQYTEATGTDLPMRTWNCVSGASWNAACKDPLAAMLEVRDKLPGNGMILMKDLHTFLNGSGPNNLALRRGLTEICISNKLSEGGRTRFFVVLANTPVPHADIAEYCDVIDFELPRYAEMEVDVVDFILNSANTGGGSEACDPDLKERITRALLGTTAEEAMRIFAYAITSSGGVNEDVLSVIAAEKAKVIRKIEGLRFIPHASIAAPNMVGGFKYFMNWLKKRARAYTRHAQSIGMEIPRGAVLIGPPGTGKTFVAKIAAKVLGLDLVCLDIGSTGPLAW